MPKQDRRGSRGSRRIPFDPVPFYTSVLRDLSEYLGLETYKELLALLISDPVAFRADVEVRTRKAETLLAEGRVFYEYTALRQIGALLKKNIDFAPMDREARRARSIDSFLSSERACRRANRRLSFYRSHWSRQGIAGEILNEASIIIQDILGDFDDALPEILEVAAHGSGVTYGSTDPEHRNLYYKICGPQTVTPSAVPWISLYFLLNPHWYDYLRGSGKKYSVIRGNRVTFVPKKWDIDRTIAVEPNLNVFIQKGFDSWFKRRAKRFGITIDNQARNQHIALEGSMNGKFATIDLSSASDSISIEVVRWLLPKPWFKFLDAIRSKEFTLDKGRTWRTYEKFSSMGNASTFPLETLIFYAIAKACLVRCGGSLSDLRVYGDDIVVDVSAYCLLTETLHFAGFKVNTEKSFAFGPFRETCGHDYVSGVNVRPVYLTQYPKTEPEVYGLYNRLLLFSFFELHTTLDYLRTLIPKPLRGPWYLIRGDRNNWIAGSSVSYNSYMITDPPSSGWSWHHHFQKRVYRTRQFRTVQPYLRTAGDEYARYLCFLLGIEEGKVKSAVLARQHIRNVIHSEWVDLPERWRGRWEEL